jgi:hypothetical protein
MARWMRCTVDELSVTARAAEYAQRIGAGKIVDFDEVIAPGFTLADALGHRADTCFEPADVQRVATHTGLPLDDDEPTDSPASPAQE